LRGVLAWKAELRCNKDGLRQRHDDGAAAVYPLHKFEMACVGRNSNTTPWRSLRQTSVAHDYVAIVAVAKPPKVLVGQGAPYLALDMPPAIASLKREQKRIFIDCPIKNC
jgi:hypothetical protein